MNEKLSDADLKEYAGWSKYDGEVVYEDVNAMAAELLALRTDAETSQNHNAGVIDRIVEQLREAGYTGTLSEMVDQACERLTTWRPAETAPNYNVIACFSENGDETLGATLHSDGVWIGDDGLSRKKPIGWMDWPEPPPPPAPEGDE